MKPIIQTVHFTADKKLLEFIEERILKLNTFFDGIIGCEVILKLEKSEDSGNKVAEIKLKISGKELFAKKHCFTFEEAVDNSIDALRAQLKKHKEKRDQEKY